MPADGIKGKTWGPSTLHQSRVRSYLPALSQAVTQNPTHFSKSAPNLDKSRAAGNDSPTNATSSHNNFLGKSVDGLNIIKTNKNNNNYGNSTKLGASVDHLNNGDRYAKHNKRYDYDDDDDEDNVTPGCFSFIGRNDDSLMKRKKHSLDSKMPHSNDTPHSNLSTHPNPNYNPNPSPVSTLHIAVKSIGMAAYAQDVGVDDESQRRNADLDLADVPYDRVFYRKMQKSLDDILMTYENHKNQPFQRVEFDRECFLVDPSDDNENGNDSSFDAGTSTNQDSSQKSIELSFNDRNPSEFSSSSLEVIYQDDQTNSSSETASTSRKNSVTFRDDDSSAQYSLLSDVSTESTPMTACQNTRIMGQYAIITHPRFLNLNQTNSTGISNVPPKSAPPKKERKEKHAYNYWRILRKKNSKTEMDEQLLDDDENKCTQAQ